MTPPLIEAEDFLTIGDTMKQKMKRLWNYFTTYEKIWFISITVLAFVFAFLFPEEDFGGVNGKVIMALYLLDILLNITCELLFPSRASGISLFHWAWRSPRSLSAWCFPTASPLWPPRCSSGSPLISSALSIGTVTRTGSRKNSPRSAA